jgi:microsomal dipeptidase-like Zn-dependent dipeptidase
VPSARRVAATTAALAVAGAAATLGAKAGGRAAVSLTERRLCVNTGRAPVSVSPRATELHATLEVVDLHADSLLWGRDLLQRAKQGQVDVPRLIDGNVALQVLAVSTQSPRHLNIERNDDRSDDIVLVAIASGWPTATWRSNLARARHQAARAHAFEARAEGRLRLLRTRDDVVAYRAARALDPVQTAGLLSIEGAHAMDGDPANVEVLFADGYRMMSPSHFFDNAFGGSAHGVEKGGLTAKGREMIERMDATGMVVDVAHASAATIDDVLAVATRPIVASHTGVRGTADNARNLCDAHLRGIAASGGVIGIGFWDTATGGRDVGSIVRAIAYAVDVAGRDHVGLGSDFDGAVTVPIDATGLVQLTDGLLAHGFDDETVGRVMGGNALRVLQDVLPDD